MRLKYEENFFIMILMIVLFGALIFVKNSEQQIEKTTNSENIYEQKFVL